VSCRIHLHAKTLVRRGQCAVGAIHLQCATMHKQCSSKIYHLACVSSVPFENIWNPAMENFSISTWCDVSGKDPDNFDSCACFLSYSSVRWLPCVLATCGVDATKRTGVTQKGWDGANIPRIDSHTQNAAIFFRRIRQLD